MTPKEIRKRLIDKDLTQAELARRNGVTIGVINHVIWNRSVSQRLRRAIAKELGLAVEEVWPDEKAA